VHFAHPTRSEFDRVVALRALRPGHYEGQAQLPPSRHWQVSLETAQWRVFAAWNGADALRLGEAGRARP